MSDSGVKSILSRATDEQLREELARREAKIAVFDVDTTPQTLNDFFAWLVEEATMFKYHCAAKQDLDCEHVLPATLSFSEWIDLFHSDWRDAEDDHEIEPDGPQAS